MKGLPMNIFKSLFRSRDKPRNHLTLSNPKGWAGFFGSTTASGKTVTEMSAMQQTAVYACCKVIAETIASLPLHVYRNSGDNKIKATDHPLYNILHLSPNPDMTAYTYLETVVMHLLLWGNSFSQIIESKFLNV